MTYPNPTNMTGIVDMFTYSNTVTGGVFGNGLLIAIYFVILMYLKINGERLQAAMIAAGFITTLISIMLFFMGVVGGWTLFLCILMTVIGALWQMFEND